MMAIADDEAVYLLEFGERRGLEGEIERLRKKTNAAIIPGYTEPLRSLEEELNQYFAGTLEQFKTPIHMLGTPFQNLVWERLRKIPYGKTISYSELAIAIGNPKATRAVAQANGANQLAIIIPCHRVINANGALGGYAGGLSRKQWLIAHEGKA